MSFIQRNNLSCVNYSKKINLMGCRVFKPNNENWFFKRSFRGALKVKAFRKIAARITLQHLVLIVKRFVV